MVVFLICLPPHGLNMAAIALSIISTNDDIKIHGGKECSPCVSLFIREENSSRKFLKVPQNKSIINQLQARGKGITIIGLDLIICPWAWAYTPYA